MKNIFKISLLALVITSVGCKKYLDQQPITAVTSTTVFADEQSAYQALIAVYSRLTGDQGYGIRLSLYYTVDNDETQGPGGTNDDDRRGMARYTLTASNAQLERPFNQLFQGIEYANVCIDQIPKMNLYTSGTDLQKKRLQRMLGEALTLRAQFYFEAIRIWGDLPAHFQPAVQQASQNPFPARVNRDTLYAQILADLSTASNLIPWQNEMASIGDPMNERLSKATAKALRARIALFAGGYSLRGAAGAALGTMKRRDDYLIYYQIAKKECADIMLNGSHKLNPDYKNLWKEQVGKRAVVDPENELLFQVTGIGGTGNGDTKLGYYNGPKLDGAGNASYIMLPTYFYAFDSMDMRRDVTCAPYNAASNLVKTGLSITAMNDGKYRRDWSNNLAASTLQWFGGKWQVIRYADVLLMYAEAENELNGPTASAYDAFNQVRRRGFGKPITTADPTVDLPTGLSKPDFFAALVKERSFEFGGEGIRKFDLIRWNLLATKLAETKQKLLDMANKVAPYDVLPTSMYLITGTTADDKTMWANSFYQPAPSTPTGTTKVTWIGTGVNTTSLARFATGFTSGKSELFPIPQAAISSNSSLTQNPGY
ncbi:MAG: RagB/SusD family nutrient uptake outer membrane protein [Bacteroidetes bacterium]|nr:RagB/SusD family nutrient uptake outer membrane protein [Bacteroidota bacterium]